MTGKAGIVLRDGGADLSGYHILICRSEFAKGFLISGGREFLRGIDGELTGKIKPPRKRFDGFSTGFTGRAADAKTNNKTNKKAGLRKRDAGLSRLTTSGTAYTFQTSFP